MQGIYIIQSISKPERIYLGSSNNIEYRFCQHKYNLKNNVHHSIKLQRHYNKYGIEDLQFKPILECSNEYLLFLEQNFLNNNYLYFNISKNAFSPMKGRKHTKDTLQKISNASKGNKYNLGKKHSDETKQLWSKQRKGKETWMKGKHHTEKSKEKMAHFGDKNGMYGISPPNKGIKMSEEAKALRRIKLYATLQLKNNLKNK